MASSALSVASPCPVGEVLRVPTDGELYREEDHDGTASVSFVRCTTLPWFSHSAGDILRLLQHARFIIDSGRAQPTLVRKATSDRSRAAFALRILRFPGLPVARTLESSRDQAFMRRGATLCSLSMVECVGVIVCNRWFRYQYVIGRINNTLLSHFTAPDQTPFRWEVFAQGDDPRREISPQSHDSALAVDSLLAFRLLHGGGEFRSITYYASRAQMAISPQGRRNRSRNGPAPRP